MLYFQKQKLRKIPYISGNRTFLHFRKRNFVILQETDLSYVSGNGNSQKLIFHERTSRVEKSKEPTLKKTSYISGNGRNFLYTRITADGELFRHKR